MVKTNRIKWLDRLYWENEEGTINETEKRLYTNTNIQITFIYNEIMSLFGSNWRNEQTKDEVYSYIKKTRKGILTDNKSLNKLYIELFQPQ